MTDNHLLIRSGRTVLLFSALLFSALLLTPQQTKAQELFGKYCSEGIIPVTVFMIDLTEVYDGVDRRRLADGANEYFQALRPGWRMDILPINDRPGEFTPITSICIPGCPEELDVGESNWTTQCDRIGIERDKRRFQAVYVDVLKQVLRAGAEAPGTEIVAGLEQAGYQYDPGEIRDLTIFSDMLENSTLNRKISSFDQESGKIFVKKAARVLESVRAFEGARVKAFGFGKRLGQNNTDKKKLPPLTNATLRDIRNAWNQIFGDVLKSGSFKLRLNY